MLLSNSCKSLAILRARRVGNVKSAALFLIFACALTIPAHADTIIVTNTNDNGPGSLRQALAIANAGDTIDATGISGVITLTTGELLVGNGVIINGAGADALAVDGNAASAVFHVRSIGPVTISDLTIRNGQGNFGGGILNGVGATLTIANSTLSGNMAAFGGGIFNEGTLTIANSTVSDNMASEGGGTYNSGNNTLTITNSTFSSNAGPATGGAVFNIGAVAISDSTVSGNSSGLAGGVFNIGTLQIGNTILNAGASGANIANNGGTVASHGYNLSSDDGGGFLTGPGDLINTDPLLGPLQDNGGPTLTHALLPGSPAIDAGDPNFTPPPFYDQRGPGFDRVRNGRIDMGSLEVQAGTTPTPTHNHFNSHAYGHIHAYADSNSYPHADTNSNSHADTYANGYSNCDALSYCNWNCYAESNSDSFFKTYSFASGYARAKVSAYSCAASSLEVQVALMTSS
jgi:hypothetical protein